MSVERGSVKRERDRVIRRECSTDHASRFTLQRSTLHVSRPTLHVSRPTLHVSRPTLHPRLFSLALHFMAHANPFLWRGAHHYRAHVPPRAKWTQIAARVRPFPG